MEVYRKCLQDAGYPATWIKDTSMDDILSTPGMKRLYTLKWCLSKFDQRIEKHLDVQDDMLENALWEALTKMLVIITDVKKEREIFQGNGNLTDQIMFWEKIFHLVHLSSLPDVDPDIGSNIFERLQPRNQMDLIPMELKMASTDLLTSSNQLLNKQQEIGNELEQLKAEKDLLPIPSEPTLMTEGAHGAAEDLDLNLANVQTSIADYRGTYASKFQGLIEKTEISSLPSTSSAIKELLNGAASMLISKLTEVIDIHKQIVQLQDEHLQFLRMKTNSLRATLENGKNKLKELRMMVLTLEDIAV